MILRDRNHPSIVIYSIGNEIHDDLSYPEGYKKYKMQEDVVKKYDDSRPVTMALFRPANSKVYLSGFAEKMDVVGQNYRENELIAAHEAHPTWKVIGTENTHVLEPMVGFTRQTVYGRSIFMDGLRLFRRSRLARNDQQPRFI